MCLFRDTQPQPDKTGFRTSQTSSVNIRQTATDRTDDGASTPFIYSPRRRVKTSDIYQFSWIFCQTRVFALRQFVPITVRSCNFMPGIGKILWPVFEKDSNLLRSPTRSVTNFSRQFPTFPDISWHFLTFPDIFRRDGLEYLQILKRNRSSVIFCCSV